MTSLVQWIECVTNEHHNVHDVVTDDEIGVRVFYGVQITNEYGTTWIDKGVQLV